ncbi:hypothetical protein YBT1518_34366 (plasmid) [Bacillus thuringiensis YBT-1518]|uniref:Uncharacterized protein n=1 Tax=Bacillus thuringiensis YBT-1518 TaxID=529122 RepID=A0A9W3PJA1_BACTU|nr:hypothetical protein [Bacillus thuringiensis]AHA75330.1 hypothetical protein YBT1518_34366 [Bacillus thuringiensis YBT-1518]
MFLRQSIEGTDINPFTLPAAGVEGKKNNLIVGKPGRGRKFNLMQELKRYAEDLVVSRKAYQAVEQAIVWKDTEGDFLARTILYLRMFPKEKVFLAYFQMLFTQMEKTPYICSHIMDVLQERHPFYRVMKRFDGQIPEEAMHLTLQILDEHVQGQKI